MSAFSLAWRSLGEHRLRNALTIAAVAISVVIFILLRTVLWAWEHGAEAAAPDRIMSRHKVSFVMPLPKMYVDEIRELDGVMASTFSIWTDAKYAANDREFFAALAVDPATFLTVLDELQVSEEAKRAWQEDRTGAIVGEKLAAKFGWKAGDRLRLTCAMLPYPGEMELTVRGIYVTTRRSSDQSMLLLHWSYFNELLPAEARDTVGWIGSRIADSSRAAEISREIDRRFDVRDVQTLTMSEGDAQRSWLGMVAALFGAIDIISLVILFIMMLIVANTIAMGVRDRMNQYAVMQALGFLPRHVLAIVLAEGLVLGALGGSAGIGVGYVFVTHLVGRFVEENAGTYLPYFRVTPQAALAAFLLALSVSVVAAVLPAAAAARTNIVEAFRGVG